jgi:hypothetical protein
VYLSLDLGVDLGLDLAMEAGGWGWVMDGNLVGLKIVEGVSAVLCLVSCIGEGGKLVSLIRSMGFGLGSGSCTSTVARES